VPHQSSLKSRTVSAEVSDGNKASRQLARLRHHQRRPNPQGIPDAQSGEGLGKSERSKKIAASGSPSLAQLVGRRPVAREENGRTPVAQLTAPEIAGIIARWRATYKLNTVRKMLAQIRQPLRQHNPSIQLPRLPVPPIRGVTAQPAEAERAITAARPALKLMLILALDSGLRYSEALDLGPGNWNSAGHSITFEGKGGYTRTVPVSERAEAIFSVLTDTTPFIQQLQPHRCPTTLHNQWCRLRKKLGLQHLNIHDFRRTIATRLYAQSKDLRAPQALLGHKWLSSTIRYIAPIGDAALKAQLEELIRPYKGKKEKTP
jgi:integrase